MGEAKRNRELARKAFLAELAEWAFPPTEWEAQTVLEIQSLPIVHVQRYPIELLTRMRMPARQCHQNARFMETNDPEGRIKHITGWWIQEGNYVLHSVILRDNLYSCVTPAPLEAKSSFDFVPDSKIEWRDEGDVRSAYRSGVRIGKGVRPKPNEMLAELEVIRQRLLSGMNPYEAVKR